MMASPQSSTSSLEASSTTPAPCSPSEASLSPCSPSILLNPLPPTTIKSGNRRLSVLISHKPSPPPAHFLAENPSYRPNASPPNAFPESRLRSSSARPAATRHASESFIENGSSSCDEDGVDADGKCKNKLSFAPLPPGRRAYRSNSLTLGVAARAKMINSQGGTPSYNSSPRYGGPQQWYQTGGVMPADVYTIDDVKKGFGKLWTKVRARKGSTASSTSAESSQAMEQEGKGKSKEIEHIEECAEEDLDSDDEHFAVAQEQVGDLEDDEDEEETRGRSLGLVMSGGKDDSSVSSTASTGSLAQPQTPSDSVEDVAFDLKGKGVDGRATSRAVAL